MPNKPTSKRTSKSSRRKTQQQTHWTKHWLTRIIVALITAALVSHYWPQLRSLTDISKYSSVRAINGTAELQIALARAGFSPGSIDGASGAQTQAALLAYQTSQGLPRSGIFDPDTAQFLQIQEPVFTTRRLGTEDFAAIGPKPQSWRGRSELDRMHYNSLLEMVAEQAQCDPDYITELNPSINWHQLAAGDSVRIPNVPPFRVQPAAGYVQITLAKRTLRVFSADHRLLFHCPVSIARRVDKRPSGELRVKVRVDQPNYTFNPAILTSTAQREGITQKFMIQPGPNNPVGTVWIGLNLPSYGIHGTPEPEKVGRTESSGCFRLANWNAQTLLDAVHVDMPIYIQP
ncbi:MAG: L,D-transpeptidase [Opitutae bacterium]|nr:L,D-transpeptidase [Opitutae bacterium]